MANNTTQLATSGNITNEVSLKITKMSKAGYELPNGYNITNALASAKLEIEEKGIVAKCSQESIVKCLLKMATYGEDISKGHFHLVPYGNECTFSEDYKGKMMRTYRDTGVVRINAQVVYEDDEFIYGVNKEGSLELVKHVPNLKSISGDKIVAAYAILVYKDGSTSMEIMTIDQIHKAWNQGATKGNSPAHKNFPDQMAKKTVISRACKLALAKATGDDHELFDKQEEAMEVRDSANNEEKVTINVNDDAEEAQVVDTETGELFPDNLDDDDELK